MIRLIAWKELRSLFAAPSTWFILGMLQFMLAWSLLVRIDSFLQVQTHLSMLANAPGASQMILPGQFGIAALLLMVLAPLFTMRLLAEERRNQTLPLLLAAPVSESRLVLGKFAGLVLFLWLIALCSTLMPLVLMLGTPMDLGLLAANGMGLLLLSAAYAALGLYISALTAQPIVAAITTMAILFGLWMADASSNENYQFWHALTPSGHFSSFNRGLPDSTSLVYYLLFYGLFLLLTIRRMHSNRSYG